MFKLVIVEDEDNIRQSLECLIPWGEIGFQLIGAFRDGTEALEYIKDNPCDAILTDILMSRMSGLEMIRQLYELQPQIKVVILSGHSEFAYAQEAIKYNVTRYLVKPVDEDELMDTFREIKKQLDLLQEEQPLPEPETEMAQTQEHFEESPHQAVASDYRLLILELDLGNRDTLTHILDEIVFGLKGMPVEEAQAILKNLYAVIEHTYKNRKISVWDVTNGKFNFCHLYRSKDIDAIAGYLKEDFCALCNGLKLHKQKSDHTVVGHLIQYLNDHLSEDIPHNVIAAKYRMHPGYLSRLFKRETGETLSDYQLRIKIEKAAVLLRTGQYKIGEIAGMVGYSASSYFSIMFKKYTGYSPREYCQRISL